MLQSTSSVHSKAFFSTLIGLIGDFGVVEGSAMQLARHVCTCGLNQAGVTHAFKPPATLLGFLWLPPPEWEAAHGISHALGVQVWWCPWLTIAAAAAELVLGDFSRVPLRFLRSVGVVNGRLATTGDLSTGRHVGWLVGSRLKKC